VNLW